MHESQAKAYLLRDLRTARQQVEEFYQEQHLFDSKKHVQQFLKRFREAHQLVTIFEYKKPTRHPWHFKHTFFYLEPTPFDEEGIGKLMVSQKTTIDSKKLIKNDLEELLKVDVAKEAVFHSHFFIRLIQRAELEGLQQALQLVAHSLATVLLQLKYDNIPAEQGEKIHTVFEDKVFVLNCETKQQVLIFKTVLLVDFMTPHQKKLFAAAITAAKKSKAGFVCGVEHEDGSFQVF
ncbi:MAG: hypothetical protein ACFHVJ_18070 [Aestuariibacter sp.]